MWFSWLFFIGVGAVAIAAAVGVVASRVPVHSALFLLLHFAMLAALYISMDAQFLGAVQVIIYAGGIVILILFVIMLLGSEPLDVRAGHRPWLPYAALGLGVLLLVGLGFSLWQAFGGMAANPAANPAPLVGGDPEVVGIELFTRYILPFELVGVLLLVALIGALLLARRIKGEAASLPGARPVEFAGGSVPRSVVDSTATSARPRKK
jgi:NADH-quinone oxidoreductase subunit J